MQFVAACCGGYICELTLSPRTEGVRAPTHHIFACTISFLLILCVFKHHMLCRSNLHGNAFSLLSCTCHNHLHLCSQWGTGYRMGSHKQGMVAYVGTRSRPAWLLGQKGSPALATLDLVAFQVPLLGAGNGAWIAKLHGTHLGVHLWLVSFERSLHALQCHTRAHHT